MGTQPSITVESRVPRNIHIGKSGDRVKAGAGGYKSDRAGISLTPVEIREYVPGDDTRHIDWKATARLDKTYVRELEGELDIETMVILDHRATMADGQEGETKLDFAREVALGIIDNAKHLSDPVGWCSVGDGGLTHSSQPNTDPDSYRLIATQLRTLQATDSQTNTSESRAPASRHTKKLASTLNGESDFDQKLRPFFSRDQAGVQRLAEEPLFKTVKTAVANLNRSAIIILITDDAYRAELREAVKLLQNSNQQILIFLTPSALYKTNSTLDLERAYRQYTDFESFRRELDTIHGVSAYEIGPSDRLAHILSTASGQRDAKQ